MTLSRYNRYLVIALSVLLINTFTTIVHAQEYKLGVVNAARILEQSPQARRTTALIENEFLPRDKQMVAEQKTLSELEEKFSRDSAIMSESERRSLEREIVAKRRDLKRSEEEFREDLTFRRNEELAKIQNEIVNAIQIVARDNNFDLVLSEGIIFASPQMDMTDLVIEYLTEQAGN